MTRAASALLPVAALGLAAGACGRDAPAPRPNVLLVTVDTLRADRLGAYGDPRDTSPNVDALAARGVVFERAIAASSKTAPSHASILTSRWVREHAVGHGNGSSALRDEPTLAEAFRAGGYRTAAFVGNLLLVRKIGLDRGFDVYDDELPTPERNRPHVVERVAEATTARALDWLAAHPDGPLFAWVHYQDPHGPYTPPAAYAERFRVPPRPDERPLPLLAGSGGRAGIPDYQVLGELRLPSAYESRYAGEIAYADASIGRLVGALDAHSSGRPAVVLLTADHGESLGEGERWFMHTHTTTPDVAHVPMILRAPGLPPARRSGLVSHVDVAPTLLALAGLPPPPDSRGVDLTDASGDGEPPERWLFCDNGEQVSAYRGDGFVRLRGVLHAWGGPAEPSVGSRYRWPGAAGWSRVPGAGGPPPELVAYAREAVAMNELPPADELTRKRLRALGYGD